ncbi:MAG TPA: S8 family serine peptidase [Allosphingosinicella sp.]|nr:S8 family serine peptidase [Allosphingosinicella sp.]
MTTLIRRAALAAAAMTLASAAAAQLLPALPPVGPVVRDVGRIGAGVTDAVIGEAGRAARTAEGLARSRLDRLSAFVRAHSDLLEMTDLGPAVRGEIVAVDPDAATLAAAREAGFTVVAEERIEGLDMVSVTLRPPARLSLDRSVAQLRRIAPAGEFAPNHLHFRSGGGGPAAPAAALASAAGDGRATVAIIDGGVAAHPALPGSAEQRGFARGAPAASAHGTAVASLAVGSGAVAGAAPRAHLLVADVYGRDPAGGSAVAIARALGWLTARGAPVVAMSLVGPPNPLVGKAVAQARARGVHIVAAVGNDGPAAPPPYPASYPGVIAVTGVDGRGRALPEAGRALHLDYAAPAADLAAAAPGGRLVRVRGTSYAVPLVAGRLALAVARRLPPLPALDAEAVDLGPRGPDRIYGRGLVCGACRTPPPGK